MKIFIHRLKTFENKLLKSGLLNFTHDLPPNAEVYLVGGTVRDILINRQTPGDLDFVVRNVEINILEKILKKYGKVNFVGKNFGVFKFQPKKSTISNQLSAINNSAIDIALPRTEHSFGTGAYKDFKITYNPKLPLKKDLLRRDFTINAMAYRVNPNNVTMKQCNNELIDPSHGLRDLQKKNIRAMGNPMTRFKEDYSRMLRAIRIACELNFSIEKKTLAAIKKLMSHINDIVNPRIYSGDSSAKHQNTVHQFIGGQPKRLVPHEIIAEEILKSFTANPIRALELLDETSALRELIPELLIMKNCPQSKKYHSEGDVWTHTKLALFFINSKKFPPMGWSARLARRKSRQASGRKNEFKKTLNTNTELIMATLFHDIGKPAVMKIRNNRISFRAHDQVGAKITKKTCQRLKFQAVPDFNIKCQNLSLLVAKHMLHLYNRISKLKNSTIVKYFLLNSKLGNNLIKLFWVDCMASIPNKGKPDLSGLEELRQRITKIKKQLKQIKQNPPLLNGHEIMKKFNLPPGPKIGRLLAILKEAQLSGLVKNKREALNFLKNEIR